MDYQSAETQIAKIEQQAQGLVQQTQDFVQKLQAAAPDATTGREWAMDLKEILLGFQAQHQNMVSMVNQMAEHIQALEQDLQSHPAPTTQARGWAGRSTLGGGGFWGNVTSGLGMGAGFAVAGDLVGGLFNAL